MGRRDGPPVEGEIMDPESVRRVQQSLGRCLLNRQHGTSFLDAFYDAFLASDPRIRPMFAKTDMEKQKDLLRHGLAMVIMYAGGAGLARSAVDQLAVKHDRGHLNVDPALYQPWRRSLLACVATYDPRFDDDLRAAWDEVLDPGIAAMSQAY